MSRPMSRRTVLTGVSTAAIASLSQCGAQPAYAAQGVNPRLLRAIALHGRARAACARYDEQVHLPTLEAWSKARDAYVDELPPPHEEAKTTFVNLNGDTVRLSTAKDIWSGVSRRVAHDPTWADMGAEDPNWRQAHIEIAAAYDRRGAILAQQKARRDAYVAETRAQFGIDAMSERADALLNRQDALWTTVFKMPAASLADVAAKIRFHDVDDNDSADFVLACIGSDVLRLAGESR